MGCLCSKVSEEATPLLEAGFDQKYELFPGAAIGSGTTSTCYVCRRRDGTSNKTFRFSLRPKIENDKMACKVVEKRKLGVDSRIRVMLLEQLHHEIAVLKKLNHPNVIPLVDVFETPEKVFIVMDLMKGGELFDCIVRKGRFSEREAIDIIAQVSSGLSHCHDQGVVHRDLKPENLLLEDKWEPWHDKNKQGRMGVVKIADFGFSRSLGTSTTRSYIGTAGYLAPELRQGKAYSKSVDVWALGVIMYVLLSGHLPFPPEAHPILEQGDMVKRFALKFHKAQWSTISMSAKELIWAMLQVDPDERCTAKDVCNHPWVKGKAEVLDAPLATVEKLRERAEKRNKALPRFHSFFVEPHQQSKADGKVKIILPSPPDKRLKPKGVPPPLSLTAIPKRKTPSLATPRTTFERQHDRELQLQQQRKRMASQETAANNERLSPAPSPATGTRRVGESPRDCSPRNGTGSVVEPGSPDRRLSTRNPTRLQKNSRSDEVHLNNRGGGGKDGDDRNSSPTKASGSVSIPKSKKLRHSQSVTGNAYDGKDMPVDPISFDDTLQLDIFGRAESPPVDRKLTVPLDQRLGQPEDSAEDSSSGLQAFMLSEDPNRCQASRNLRSLNRGYQSL